MCAGSTLRKFCWKILRGECKGKALILTSFTLSLSLFLCPLPLPLRGLPLRKQQQRRQWSEDGGGSSDGPSGGRRQAARWSCSPSRISSPSFAWITAAPEPWPASKGPRQRWNPAAIAAEAVRPQARGRSSSSCCCFEEEEKIKKRVNGFRV